MTETTKQPKAAQCLDCARMTTWTLCPACRHAQQRRDGEAITPLLIQATLF